MIVARFWRGPTHRQVLEQVQRAQRDLAAVLARGEFTPAVVDHLHRLERRLRATLEHAENDEPRTIEEGGSRRERRRLRPRREHDERHAAPAVPTRDVGEALTGASCVACGWPLRVRDAGECPACSGGGHLA